MWGKASHAVWEAKEAQKFARHTWQWISVWMSTQASKAAFIQLLIHSHASLSWQKVPTASCWLPSAPKSSSPCSLAPLVSWLRGRDLGKGPSPYTSILWYRQWWRTGQSHIPYYYFTNSCFLFSNSFISPCALSHKVSTKSTPRICFGFFSIFTCIPRLVWQSRRLYQKRAWAWVPFAWSQRFGQRTNQHKVEIFSRTVTLTIKPKLGMCGALQNQSCAWRNTPCFNKTAVKLIYQV